MKTVSEINKKNFIKALNNRILLKKDKAITKRGSIHLIKTEGMYAPPYSGVIISVGDNVKDSDIKKGKRVTFTDMAGVEFDINDETIFSIREQDITSVIDHGVSIE